MSEERRSLTPLEISLFGGISSLIFASKSYWCPAPVGIPLCHQRLHLVTLYTPVLFPPPPFLPVPSLLLAYMAVSSFVKVRSTHIVKITFDNVLKCFKNIFVSSVFILNKDLN